MSGWSGPGGQQQPYGYQEPVPGQQGWPGAFQQPGGAVQPTGQYQPMPGDGYMGGEAVLVSIGDISVTSTTVFTPSGSCPLSEASFTFTDMSVTSQNIPTWAIICAIVFFAFCLVGLLFLLAKENSTQGSVQVTVRGPNLTHTATIPVTSIEQVADLNSRVGYAQSMATFSPAQLPGTPDQSAGEHPPTQVGQATPAQPWQQPSPTPTEQVQPWQQAQPGQPWQQGQQGQAGQAGQPWQQGEPGQQWQQGEPGQQGQQWQQGQPGQ